MIEISKEDLKSKATEMKKIVDNCNNPQQCLPALTSVLFSIPKDILSNIDGQLASAGCNFVQVVSLYGSEQYEDIKNCFKIFEEVGYTLADELG